MGKSDSLIFPEYLKILEGTKCNSVAFLGFSSENNFTKSINSPQRHFYDLSLKNWDINSDWSLSQKYDLIISTRCPYFAKNPRLFVNKCIDHTNTNGHILLDWGLGGHWEYSKYKVGWVRDGEHEWFYQENNYLYSCFWKDEFIENIEVQKFWKAVKNNKNFGYQDSDLISVVKREIPQLFYCDVKSIKFKSLWLEDKPQLYIIVLINKL